MNCFFIRPVIKLIIPGKMKKIFFVLVVALFSCNSEGQNTIESLFRRYSGNEGYTSVSLSGDLLRLVDVSFSTENEEGDCHEWSAHVKELRLLIQDNEEEGSENFYKTAARELERSGYEEFLRINNYDEDLVMLVKYQGNLFREFVVIGGGDDNLLIQVKGNMTRNEARCFSDNLKRKRGIDIIANIH